MLSWVKEETWAHGIMNEYDTPMTYIVDADPALRDSLAHLLGSVSLCTRTLADTRAFLAAYQPERPGCLLLDIDVSGRADPGIQRYLQELGIDLPVIVMTNCGNIKTVVTAMKYGAMDFIEKPLNEQMVLDCIHSALAEDTVRQRTRIRRKSIQRRFETLTPREQDVLKRVSKGFSNQQIADDLQLSRKTVEAHRAKVMQKMQAATLSRLIRMAMIIGILKIYELE